MIEDNHRHRLRKWNVRQYEVAKMVERGELTVEQAARRLGKTDAAVLAKVKELKRRPAG